MIRLSQIQTKHCLATTNNLVPGFVDRMWRFSFFFFFFKFVSVFRNHTAFVTKYFRASVRAGDVGFCFLSRFQTTHGRKGQQCQVWGFKVCVLKSQLVAVCSCATYVELFHNGNGRKRQLLRWSYLVNSSELALKLKLTLAYSSTRTLPLSSNRPNEAERSNTGL